MGLLINLLVLLLICGLIYWIITLIPLPPPFKNIALIIFGIIVIIYLISMLTGNSLGLPALK
jgi:hypothetical protein